MMGFGMGFGLIGLFLMLLFWGGLILLGVWLVRTIFQTGSRSVHPGASGTLPTAREILDERYARGEINREQYEIMKRDIG
jgi:putative membrane protein